MVVRITAADAQAWVDSNKLAIDATFLANDASLEAQIENNVIARLQDVFVTTTWVDSASTPLLVRTVISMMYVAAVYRRQISQVSAQTGFRTYPDWLEQSANLLLQGLIDGTYDIGQTITSGQPAFYPTDSSSAMDPSTDDQSLGDAHFSMGTVF